MGATGSGKTTSCTSVVQAAAPFELDGRRVLLIDTPGFDDTSRSDTDILKMIAHFLSTTQVIAARFYKNGIRLSGVIYMHRISDFRMGGVSRRNFGMFRQLCGESSLKNVVLVTNMWSEVSAAPVLDRHARLLRHQNTLESAQSIMRYLIGNRPMALQIQHELVDQNMDISQTGAGAELNRELMRQIRKHQQELLDLRIEIKSAIKNIIQRQMNDL
ncbi:hypothetical protein PILCRDRAFT_96579 [Piloderma croceum F 1598]|uniref:G domain-containing protein n=1 Tax=Piloderma croceum (strain F 1598) TaxID=765440 RepID=A0A0C3BER8_PILCF|nr:hypothetical protein PILCRDRAFT_96579 [Piloderma croceum F 1598]